METEKSPLAQYLDTNAAVVADFEFGESGPPQVSGWRSINDMVFPENRWLVTGLLPKEGMSIIASVSGEGKSLVVMHLARCIAEGTPWFGCEAFETQKRRVLYINLEMSISEIQRRGRKIGFDPLNDDLLILNSDDFNLNEGLGQDDLKYKWLLSFIHEKKIGVVIVDTFRAVAGGLKEEKAEEVRKFFQKFLILKNSGVSIIFLEHVRKPSQFEGKAPKKEALLGSQDKTANAEVLLMLRKDEATGFVNIYQRKNRIGEEMKPFAVKVFDSLDAQGRESLGFEYAGEIDEDGTKKDEAKNLVLDILLDGEPRTVKELGAITKKQVGKKNLRLALNELKLGGKVDFFKKGKEHCYFKPKEGETLPKDELDAIFDSS